MVRVFHLSATRSIAWISPTPLGRRFNIRLAEIVPLEQERLPCCLRQRIGKTIAKIQRRFMTAFAELEKRLPSQVAMLDRHGFDDNAGADQGRRVADHLGKPFSS